MTSVWWLRAGFNFHFPVKGLSAAHIVALARHMHSNIQVERFAIDSSRGADFPGALQARRRPSGGWELGRVGKLGKLLWGNDLRAACTGRGLLRLGDEGGVRCSVANGGALKADSYG